MFQILEMLRERHEQYLLQILKIDKFGNYSVVDPLKSLMCYRRVHRNEKKNCYEASSSRNDLT